MFEMMIEIYEASAADSSLFTGDPHTYQINSTEMPPAEALQDLLYMAMEIDGLNGECLVESTVEKDGEYVQGDAWIVRFVPVLTDKPSTYVNWGDKKPHIFQLDREKSRVDLVEE